MKINSALRVISLASSLAALAVQVAVAAPAAWPAETPYDYGLGQCAAIDRCTGADWLTDNTHLMDYGLGHYASLADFLDAGSQWARAGAQLASR